MRTKKSFSVLYLSLIFASISFSQVIPEDDVPLSLIGMHYSQFPNAKSTVWQKTNTAPQNSMTASFVFNKKKYTVKYNTQGKKLIEQVSISEDELYPSIYTELEMKHGKFKVTSLTKNIHYENEQVVNEYYILSLKTKSSLIDEFLNTEMELGSKPKSLFASINK